MEMNEGYQDREDPGLTVRFPLVDRPGRVAAGLDDDALDAGRQRRGRRRARPALRPGPPGRRPLLAGQGDAQAGAPGPVPGLEERAGSELVGWRYAGPFDELPAVRDAFARGAATSTASSPGSEVGEDEGTGIVHIAPGCGAEDYQLGKALGLPVIGPLDEDGRYYDGLRLARPAARRPAVTEAIVDDLEQRRLLLPPGAVHPPLPALLALRHAAAVPARGRVVHHHGRGLRQAARAS